MDICTEDKQTKNKEIEKEDFGSTMRSRSQTYVFVALLSIL
jgi:hypothetical protein